MNMDRKKVKALLPKVMKLSHICISVYGKIMVQMMQRHLARDVLGCLCKTEV